MKFKELTIGDVVEFAPDILKCYNDCSLIFDSQNPIKLYDTTDVIDFLSNFVLGKDSEVIGIISDSEEFLYGVIIFDNIRFANKSCAQCHIINDKAIWGRKVKGLYEKILGDYKLDTIYCEIPSCAPHVIAMCKRLGFKKTGYIPEALPYRNLQGIAKMYDILIYTYQRKD